MSKQEVEIYFKVEGLDGYITDLNDLKQALGQVETATKEASDEQNKASKSAGLFGKALEGAGKLGKKGFQLIGAGIKATGLGIFLDLGARLVEWFNQTDVGAKLIQGSLATVGVIFNKIGELLTPLGEQLGRLFSDPKQALIDFGTAIKDNIISRFEGILNFIPNIASAIENLFKGNFKEAATIAANAVGQVVTGNEDIVGTLGDVADAVVETFSEVVSEVGKAITASNNLIDAQNRLKNRVAELTTENAKLNQELETQQKIADDTTRSYEDRKAALDRVNVANEQLTANAVEQAQLEKDALQRAYDLAATDAERRELKQELADAEATLTDAQTQQQIVRLESAQLNRELDQEEADRKQSIADLTSELIQSTITDEREAARESLRIAEEQALKELEALAATEEEKELVREQFRVLRKQQDDKFRAEDEAATEDSEKKKAELEEQFQSAKFDIAKNALGAISALQQAFASEDEERAKKNFKIQKALQLATATISGTEAVINAYKTAQASPITALFPGYPFVQAGLAGAFAAAQIATIARTQFESPGTVQVGGGGGGGGNPGASINYSFGQQAGGTIQPGQSSTGGQPAPQQVYVLASDVTNAQQAQQQINNLAKL